MKSFLILLLNASTVFSATINIGVFDELVLFTKYDKAVQLEAELNKSIGTANAALAEKGKAHEQMRKEFEELRKQSQNPILSENGKKNFELQIRQKEEEIAKREREIQKFVAEAERNIASRRQQNNKQILDDIRIHSDKVAKAKGLQIVLSKSSTFFCDTSLDVTDSIVKELNDSYKLVSGVSTENNGTPVAVPPANPVPAAGDKPAAK